MGEVVKVGSLVVPVREEQVGGEEQCGTWGN